MAGMLHLQPPGMTVYSRVLVPEGTEPRCQEASLLCAPPAWDGALGGFAVAESWGEGLARYEVIARAFDRVADREWRMPEKHRRSYLTAVAFNESGFRRDVHLGIGDASRGDCVEDGGTQLCRSVCLGQMNIGRGATPEGYRAEDLVRDSPEATERCATAMMHQLDRAWSYCAQGGEAPRPLEACMFAMYGGKASIFESEPVKLRVRSIVRLRAAPKALKPEVRVALGLASAVPAS